MKATKLQELLFGICEIADADSDMLTRRTMTLELTMDLLQADFGHWAWGYGDAISFGVIPVAVVTHGYDDQQKALMYQMAMNSQMELEFRKPIVKLMAGKSQFSCERRLIFDDLQWQASSMRTGTISLGADEWIQGVRYSNLNTWSNFFLLRNLGAAKFEQFDVELIDLLLASVPWLHANTEESITKESLSGVTERQSTVMLMILDGFSRKMIATKLGISQETVGDHVKAIYRHFNVNSATELAAHFLRSK